MTRTLRHRGPDDEGFLVREYEDGVAVGLGFRRLSIIDLESGNQPIGNEDGSVQVVFNGEIYNFAALRRGARGARPPVLDRTPTPRSSSHLYEELGASLRRAAERDVRLRALGRRRGGELLLARDRFGKKPLYYAAGRPVASLRLRAQGAARAPELPARARPAALSRLPRARVRARRRSRSSRASEAARRARRCAGATAGRRSSATGISSFDRARSDGASPTTSTPRSCSRGFARGGAAAPR